MKVRLAAAGFVTAFVLAGGGPSPVHSNEQLSSVARTASTADETAIRAVLDAYNEALNGGRTEAVLPLYARDGIFMAPYQSSFIGKDAVRRAYDGVFAELKFDVKFDIAEVVQLAPTWAFVRTNSAGRTQHHSTGKTTAEANQELFIFKKSDGGHWQIARYSFSPTNPPK